MKKNYYSLLLLFSCSSITIAQVGINNTAPASTLDITAKNATGTSTNVDGLLIPRVDRERAQSMTSVSTSTLVYVNNIATGTLSGTAVNVDAEGYYYFDGSVWIKLNPSSTAAWNLTGNAGTNPANGTGTGTDFLGTTDAQDFQIKVGTNSPYNNIMRVNNANGHTQFGNWWDTSTSPNHQNADKFLNGLAIQNYPSNFTVANNFAASDLTGTVVGNTRSAAYVNATSAIPFFANFRYAQFNNGYTGPINGDNIQVRLDGNATYNVGSQNIVGSQSIISLIGTTSVTTTAGMIGSYSNISVGGSSVVNGPVYATAGRFTTAGTFNGNTVGIRGSFDGSTPTYNSGFSATGVQGILNTGNFNGTSIGVSGSIAGGVFAPGSSSYGLHSNVSGTGVANGYGLYIENVSGTASQWGVYQSGANDTNYFAGNTGIGTNLPQTLLHLNKASLTTNEAVTTMDDYSLILNSGSTGSNPIVYQPARTEGFSVRNSGTGQGSNGTNMGLHTTYRFEFFDAAATTPFVTIQPVAGGSGATYPGGASSAGVGIGDFSTLPITESLDIATGSARIRNINASAGTASDNIVVADATGVLKTVAPSVLAANNIYNANGTLTGNRTVTMGTNSLSFANGSNRLILSNTATDANANLLATNRANMRWGATTSYLDIFQDTGAIGQIAVSGASTGLLMGSSTGSTAPVRLMTNGTTALTAINGGNVGIGTDTPTGKLHVNGNMILGTATSTSGSTGFSSVVRDNTTGELKVAVSSTGNTSPFNYITYTLGNVNGDWISDYNTRIPSSDYTVIVVGSTLTGVPGLVKGGAGADFNAFNVAASASGGTWHLSADYANAGTAGGGNATWVINCVVINNSVIKTLTAVSQNLGGLNNGDAGTPPSGL